MTSDLAIASLIEQQRRAALRKELRAAVQQKYEVTRETSDQVPRSVVYRHVAAVAKVDPVTNDFCMAVRLVVAEMGAMLLRPRNVKVFARLRERAERDPPRAVRRAQVHAIRRKWEARLRAEGLELETSAGFLKRGAPSRAIPGWWDVRREINTAFLSKAADHYWRLKRHLDVWGLYVLEGVSVDDIAQRLDIAPAVVGRIVKAMRVAMGERSKDPRVLAELRGHPDLVQETSDGPAEGAEGQRDLDD